jgi:uncharacterized DUF497 family protein
VAVLRFEWDDRKNSQNRRRQGVSFEEAQTVFFDEQALLVADRDHSEHEEPFILLGLWSALRTLAVCHSCRREGFDSFPRERELMRVDLNERTRGFDLC